MWLRLGTQKKGTIIQQKDRYHLAKKLVDMTGEQKCIHTLNKSIYKRAVQKEDTFIFSWNKSDLI